MSVNIPKTRASVLVAPAAQAAVTTAFSLTPNQHNANTPLDYSSANAIKLYKACFKKLGLKACTNLSMKEDHSR